MTVPMTLAEARTNVAQLLDDPNNRRWSTAQVDFALSSALSRCQSDYIADGGERFDEQTTGTTSATDGTVSLVSSAPAHIKSVVLDSSSTYIPIRAANKRDKYRADTSARSIVLIFVREYVLPTTTSHALVGNGATAANTWAAFDFWVVARAALQLAVKDADLAQACAVLEADTRNSVLQRQRLPQAVEWPRASSLAQTYAGLRWTWLPASQQLQLVQTGREW